MKIDNNFNLTGDYPSILDLGNCDLDFERLMDNPYANLIITNEDTLEHLKIGNTFWQNNTVTIKDCKKLKTIEIYDDGLEYSAKWVACQNLPALEKLTVRGDILSLEIGSCTILKEVDLDMCKKIAHVNFTSFGRLEKICIDGCIKLSCVGGIPPEILKNLNVDFQILNNSNLAGNLSHPFSDLTFKQIDDLLRSVNIILSRKTLFSGFIQYSINLLEPGENTYSGSTGEVYAYELYDGSGYGEHSPEDCLLHAISRVADVLEIQGTNFKDKINNTVTHIMTSRSFYEDSQVNQSSKLVDGENISDRTELKNSALEPMIEDNFYKSFEHFPTFTIGCNVHHAKFGDGLILDREGPGYDPRVQVEFLNSGTKWLALSVAKLTLLE